MYLQVAPTVVDYELVGPVTLSWGFCFTLHFGTVETNPCSDALVALNPFHV